MSNQKDNKVKQILSQFTPEERGFAEGIAQIKIDNQTMTKQLIDLRHQHDNLWRIMVSLLVSMPDKQLQFHGSQLLRFKEEYRIDQTTSKDGIITLRLKTLTDK